MAVLSQGTTVNWNSTKLTVTRVSVSSSGGGDNSPRISVASLESPADKEEPTLLTWAAPAGSGGGNTVQIDYIGGSLVAGANGTVTITGSFPIVLSNCTVLNVSETFQVADIARYSANIAYTSAS